eukprot:10051772-Lingulodinium_polyedra.AAC.1
MPQDERRTHELSVYILEGDAEPSTAAEGPPLQQRVEELLAPAGEDPGCLRATCRRLARRVHRG